MLARRRRLPGAGRHLLRARRIPALLAGGVAILRYGLV